MGAHNIQFWNRQLLIIDCGDGTYYTQILDAARWVIQHPATENNERMHIPVDGRPVSVYFYNDEKELYTFKAAVTQQDDQIVLTPPTDVKKVQRRHFFRVPAVLDVVIETEQEEEISGATVNISGGGLLIACPRVDNFHADDTVTGTLYLDQKKEKAIPFTAKIIRIDPTHERPRLALEFIDIKEVHRKAIIQYGFKIQLDMRNKLDRNI